MRRFIAGLLLGAFLAFAGQSFAAPARRPPVVCATRDGEPVYCRCVPSGLPVDPAAWPVAGRLQDRWEAGR